MSMGVENNMPDGWLYTELGKVSENIFSGGTPNTKINQYWNGSLNWLSSGETGSNFIYSTIKSITQLGVDNSSTRLALKDDVVVATAGQGNTRGQVSFMCIDSYINQSIIAIRGNKNALFNKWLFYNLSHRYKELRFISESNSVRGSITTKMLSSLIKLKLPPLPEQRAIAKVLTAFDDKIELLQAQNKTLETMAQTIFKEWFGKYQIGDELPEGWRVGEFGELFDLTMGLSPKGDSYNHDMIGVPLLNGAGDYSGEKLDPKRYTSKPTRINKVGDLVFCIRGTIGKIVFANKEYCLGRGIAALTPIVSNDKYFNYIKLSRIINELTRNATGSVILGLSKDDISKAELILPARERLDEFSEVVRPLFNKLEINQNQIQSLTKTRDTLLPKLMSGQVRVNNIKQTADA